MTIEFRCDVCQKLLRTTDDKAGLTAKCPQCGSALTVPSETSRSESSGFDAPGERFEEAEAPHPEPEESDDWGRVAEVGAPPAEAMRPCPMCGEQVRAEATRCRYCGERLSSSAARERRPSHVDAGTVINASWRIFQSQMGICMGLVLLAALLNGVVAGACEFIGNMVQMQILQANQNNLGLAIAVAFVIQQGPPLVVGSFLSAGLAIGLLKLARGENAEIGDLFAGGPYFLRMLGLTILFQLMLLVGLALCIVPGIFVALIFWPYSYLLVDRDLPGIGALSEASRVTQNTWGQVFVLALAAIGITILGFLALCIGLLFTLPLTALMFAVAYCHMTGQATAEG